MSSAQTNFFHSGAVFFLVRVSSDSIGFTAEFNDNECHSELVCPEGLTMKRRMFIIRFLSVYPLRAEQFSIFQIAFAAF